MIYEFVQPPCMRIWTVLVRSYFPTCCLSFFLSFKTQRKIKCWHAEASESNDFSVLKDGESDQPQTAKTLSSCH